MYVDIFALGFTDSLGFACPSQLPLWTHMVQNKHLLEISISCVI